MHILHSRRNVTVVILGLFISFRFVSQMQQAKLRYFGIYWVRSRKLHNYAIQTNFINSNLLFLDLWYDIPLHKSFVIVPNCFKSVFCRYWYNALSGYCLCLSLKEEAVKPEPCYKYVHGLIKKMRRGECFPLVACGGQCCVFRVYLGVKTCVVLLCFCSYCWG